MGQRETLLIESRGPTRMRMREAERDGNKYAWILGLRILTEKLLNTQNARQLLTRNAENDSICTQIGVTNIMSGAESRETSQLRPSVGDVDCFLLLYVLGGRGGGIAEGDACALQ